jgi:hypothetical protein
MRRLRPTHDAPEVTGGLISSGRDFARRARRGDFSKGVLVRVGGRIFFDETELLAYLEAGGVPPLPTAARTLAERHMRSLPEGLSGE